jgi:hypothetical protein
VPNNDEADVCLLSDASSANRSSASRAGVWKTLEEITYAIVDLKKHFAELDGAITYQVRAPKILPYPPFETKLSYMKLP